MAEYLRIASLNLFRTPTSLAVPHVSGGLNRRCELKRAVTQADETDNRSSDLLENAALENEAAYENIDYNPLDCPRRGKN